MCVTVVKLPWGVRALSRLRGCVSLDCALPGTIAVRALYKLTWPIVVPTRREIASGCICARRVVAEPRVVCVRHKSNPRCDPGIDVVVW